MRRFVILIPLFVLLASGSVFAQSSGLKYLAGLGVSYLALNQSYTTSTGVQDVTLSGVGIESNFMTGRPLGVFGSVALDYALAGSRGGTPLDMSVYSTRLLFNMLVGLGYRARLTARLALLTAGGVNAVGALVTAPKVPSSLDLAYAGGFGAVAQVQYALTSNLEVFVNAMGAYDPIAIAHATNLGFKKGFLYSAGAGLDMLY